MIKCVSLHNDKGVAVGEGICCNASSDLVIWTARALRRMHVVVQISKTLKEVLCLGLAYHTCLL
jgi:hypothetical protein